MASTHQESEWVNPFVNKEELAWLAGWLEGEGCFRYHTKTFNLKVIVCTTDKDVMEKGLDFMHRLGLDHINLNGPYKRRKDPNGKRKPVWRIDVTGDNADVLMFHLRPLMGERRKAAIDKALEQRKEKVFTPKIGICAYSRCSKIFLVRSARHKFCSKGYCRSADGMLRKRQKQKELSRGF